MQPSEKGSASQRCSTVSLVIPESCGGFPKLGIPFQGSLHKLSHVWGSTLGSPVLGSYHVLGYRPSHNHRRYSSNCLPEPFRQFRVQGGEFNSQLLLLLSLPFLRLVLCYYYHNYNPCQTTIVYSYSNCLYACDGDHVLYRLYYRACNTPTGGAKQSGAASGNGYQKQFSVPKLVSPKCYNGRQLQLRLYTRCPASVPEGAA